MNITADQIQQTCSSTQLIEHEIKTILKTMQSEIIEAGKNGSTSVVVSVPTNFNIVNMSNQTAQTIVYHRLIEDLEENGFNVKLAMEDSYVTYCIRWDIQKDDKDLKNMRNIIASHLVSVKQEKKDSGD